MDRRGYLRRALLLLLALAFLFETWIWDRVVAVAQRVAALVNWAAIRAALIRVIDRLPVWVALLMFGIPFVVAETGAAFCVFFAATGHILAGSVGYIIVKIFGFGLVVPIFDLTRQKLMTLPLVRLSVREAARLPPFRPWADRAVPRRREEAGRRICRPRPRAVDAPERRGERRSALTGARGAAPVLPYRVRRNDDRARPRQVAAASQPGLRLDAPPAAWPVVDARRPDVGHGHRQRDAGFVLRRRPLCRRRSGGLPWRAPGRRGRGDPRRRRRIDATDAPSRFPPTWRRRASCRSSPRWRPASRRRFRSTPTRRASPRRRSKPARRSSTTSGGSSATPTWRAWSRRPARPRC